MACARWDQLDAAGADCIGMGVAGMGDVGIGWVGVSWERAGRDIPPPSNNTRNRIAVSLPFMQVPKPTIKPIAAVVLIVPLTTRICGCPVRINELGHVG